MQRSLIKATNGQNRHQPVKQRLFTKSPPRLSSNKPLPCDPLLKAKASQRATRKAGDASPPANTADGEPNAATTSQSKEVAPKTINRAKSCSAIMGEAHAGTTTPPPRTPGKLTKKFSRPFLTKRTTGEKTSTVHNRPATAPARILKSRSASMEQLKALWANNGPRTQQPTAKSAARPRASPPADGPEKMKSQISQFLKTDRVVEAWDNVATKISARRNNFAKSSRDWPCSIFRTKTPAPWRDHPENNGDLSGADLERQMSWVHASPESLNTYTLRQRPDVSPRIHVLAVQSALDEEIMARPRRDETQNVPGGDAGVVITALPTVSPRPAPISSVRSSRDPIRNNILIPRPQFITRHRPRMVGVA